MDSRRFDTLARALSHLQAGGPTHNGAGSRRFALRSLLGMIVGVALSAEWVTETEAAGGPPEQHLQHRKDRRRQKHRNDTHRRRDKQRRHDGGDKPSGTQGPLRSISMLIDNSAGSKTLSVEFGYVKSTRCCQGVSAVQILPGRTQEIDILGATQAYAWLANAYWFEFDNPFAGRPDASAAVNGMMGGARCCKPGGHTVLHREPFEEGKSQTVDLNGKVFTIQRNPDKPDFKVFTVGAPATL